jgi:two-component system, chemotaxis family, chemotaxis protein CheY
VRKTDTETRDTRITPKPTASVNDLLTVVVADADPDAREAYKRLLTAGGVRVVEAADGREALVQIFKARPDALVMDVRLPFIDGLQLCGLIRHDESTAALRVVAITNDPEPPCVQRIRDRGADVVFVKPVDLAALAAAVRADDGEQLSPGDHADDRAPATAAPSGRRLAKVRARDRYVTTRPPLTPPPLRCPLCDGDLQYDRSHIGGVNDRSPEQWDSYECAQHGTFQYRHRTRKLRQVS